MIIANIKPLPIKRSKTDSLYKLLEIYMQALGLLTPFRENFNWEKEGETFELGSIEQLKGLQKCAAQSDGLILIIAKLFKNTIYRHLILHPNVEGYYLPLRFEEPFLLEQNGKKYWFGSAVRLDEELGWLALMMESKFGNQGEIFTYWENLRKCCQLSVETMTPIQLTKEK